VLSVQTLQKKASQPKFAPLSLAQQRLWLHEQSEPGSVIYNISVAYQLIGPLNEAILRQSLTEIVRRHETLRTIFAIVDAQPVQVISAEIALQFPVINLQDLPPTEREAESQRLAHEDARQPFDLTQGPLWRFKLLHLTEDHHVLLLTIHHIISDRWSIHLLMQELTTLYAAGLDGKPSPLTELPHQYADFAIWQRQWLEGEKQESQLAYWQQQLGGSIAPLQLPIDQTRTLVSTYSGARQSLVLSSSLTTALKALSEQEKVTLFMTLLAAFQMLLYQYTQQEDMVLCSPIAGRHRFQTKELIGYFINVLPMRTDLSGNPSFRDLLGRVRKVVSATYKNLDLPFQTITDLPNLVRMPLTRGFFALQPSVNQLTGITSSFEDIHNGTANFDLSLFMEEKGDTLTGLLDYKTDLFNATTITQMLEHFQALLESLVANPDQALSSLPRLREIEDHPATITQSPSELAATYVAPQKEIEQTIATVWQEVLQLEKVGIHHNFFELGGHSLAVARTLSKLRQIFAKEISIVDLFRYPTISGMAQFLSQDESEAQSDIQQVHDSARRQKEALKRRQQFMKQRSK